VYGSRLQIDRQEAIKEAGRSRQRQTEAGDSSDKQVTDRGRQRQRQTGQTGQTRTRRKKRERGKE
jgi:hypothetical protein